MEISLVGTSEHPEVGDRSISCVISDGGESILLDCGPSFVPRWCGAGHSAWDLQFVLVTHVHPDHASGLPGLVATAAMEAAAGKRPDGRVLDLLLDQAGADVYTPVLRTGTPQAFRGGDAALCTISALALHGAKPFRKGDWYVRYTGSAHSVPGLAANITLPSGASVAYVGDSKSTGEISELTAGAQVLVCSVFGPQSEADRASALGFMTAADAGTLARKIGAKVLICQHVFRSANRDQVLKEATEAAGGSVRVLLGRNGENLSVGG